MIERAACGRKLGLLAGCEMTNVRERLSATGSNEDRSLATSKRRPPRISVPRPDMTSPELPSVMAELAIEYGPIFSVVPEFGPLAGRRVVYLVGPEANRFALFTHPEYFSHDLGWSPVFGESLGRGLANMDGPEHSTHRAFLSPAFGTVFLDRYAPFISTVIAEHLRNWAVRGQVDLAKEAREISFDVAAGVLLGLKPGTEVDLLRDRFFALLREPSTDTARDSARAATRVRNELDRSLLEIIAARRRSSTRDVNDVLDILVRAVDEQRCALADKQILAHINILLVAGHETTTNLAAWLLYMLAKNPEHAKKVDDELEEQLGQTDLTITSEVIRRLPVLKSAIRETGRLKPPVMFLPRVAITEFEFGGCFVPAGTPVFIAVAAGQRLRTVFHDPDKFDPSRFLPPREEDKRQPYAMVTFGGGSRVCLGVNLAQMELAAFVAAVRRRYQLVPELNQEIVQLDGVVQCLPYGIGVSVFSVPERSHGGIQVQANSKEVSQ